MRILSLLAVALLVPSCATGTPTLESCASVFLVKASPEACVGQPIRIKAYLVSTRHGDYLVDEPSGKSVLSVEYSQAKAHRKSTAALLERLGRANIGKPYAQIHGVFEGHLLVGGAEKGPRFEVYLEIE